MVIIKLFCGILTIQSDMCQFTRSHLGCFCLDEVYSIQHSLIKFVCDATDLWFPPGTPVSSTYTIKLTAMI